VLAPASASPWAAVRRRGGSAADALARSPDAAVGVLLGGEGAASGRPAEEAAGQAALGAAMAEAAEALFPAVLAALAVQADRREHDALSPDDIKVFQTPPGAWPACTASSVRAKGVACTGVLGPRLRCRRGSAGGRHQRARRAGRACKRERSERHRRRAHKCAADSQGERVRPGGGRRGCRPRRRGGRRPRQDGSRQGRRAQRPRRGDAGAAASAGGGGARRAQCGPSRPPAHAALDAGDAAQVRARVVGVRDGLARGLRALAGAAVGNLAFTAQRLEAYAALVVPLLSSPLVGEGAAFAAAHALAASLPGALGRDALAVACSLRLVELGQGEGAARRGAVCLQRGFRAWLPGVAVGSAAQAGGPDALEPNRPVCRGCQAP